MGGCCAPAFGPRGPGLPEGRALRPPAPPGSLPHSVARHAWRSDPDATAKGANAAALPHRSLACMRGRSAGVEPRSAREGKSGGLTPPPWVPRRRALRRARPPPSDVGRATDAPPPSVPFPPIDELTLGRKLATLYIWMVTGTPSAQCHVVQPETRRYPVPCSVEPDFSAQKYEFMGFTPNSALSSTVSTSTTGVTAAVYVTRSYS